VRVEGGKLPRWLVTTRGEPTSANRPAAGPARLPLVRPVPPCPNQQLGAADVYYGWLISPSTQSRIECPRNSSTRDTGHQSTPFLTSMRKPLLSSRSREDHGISKHPFGIFARGEPPCCVIRLLPFTVTASRRHVRNRDAAMNPAIGLTSQYSPGLFQVARSYYAATTCSCQGRLSRSMAYITRTK
jgi:hypothetical protein